MVKIILPEEIKLEKNLAERCRMHIRNHTSDDSGATSQVHFLGNLVLRSNPDIPKYVLAWTYLKEAFVSRDLASAGLNVPQVYGISADEDFIVLATERIFGKPIEGLSCIKRFVLFGDSAQTKAKQSLTQQVNIARKMGYVPQDFGGSNCLVDQQGNVYQFDFGAWEVPPTILEKINTCGVPSQH